MGIGSFIGNNVIKLGMSLKGMPQLKSLDITRNLNALSSTHIINGTPVWRNLSTLKYLLECYKENFIVQTVINIKADAFSNMEFIVKDIKTGDETPLREYDKDGGKLKALIAKPNPLQSTFEWLKQYKVYLEVFGNSYSHAFVPVGFEEDFNYIDIQTINNLPPYYMTPVLTGSWLKATTKSEIISRYDFSGFNNLKKEFNTEVIMHSNNVNITFDEHFTEGVSKLVALKEPITNISMAFESRNVMIRKRGALGILTSDKKDGVLGNIPLKPEEIEETQEANRKYGLLDNQFGLLISPQALKYQKMAMSVKDLMLFEEIESDTIAIATDFGVPESLVRQYIKKGSLGSDSDVDEKRMYDSTIIPEAKDFMVVLNNFFKTEEQGIELLGSFDHLKVLQTNKKDEAEKDKRNMQGVDIIIKMSIPIEGKVKLLMDTYNYGEEAARTIVGTEKTPE